MAVSSHLPASQNTAINAIVRHALNSASATNKTMSESDILRSCLDWLAYKNVFHWRQNQGAIPLPNGGYRRFNGRKGLPDIVAILPPQGTYIAIEVKKPGGKMSNDQKDFHEELVRNGGVSIVVTSVDELMADWEQLDQGENADTSTER